MTNTTQSPEMQDAVARIENGAMGKQLAALFRDQEAYDKAWLETAQAGIDIATLMRAGEPVPEEMPGDPEEFLDAYPEGCTPESLLASAQVVNR